MATKGKPLTPLSWVDLDPDYGYRMGYDADFLGPRVDLPALSDGLKPLATLPVLAYEHFSILLHPQRKLAFWTASNIDGAHPVVMADRQADKWWEDSRAKGFQTKDKAYKNTGFQRGHLVRRLDPAWGDETAGARGEADSFHWSNCSPQVLRPAKAPVDVDFLKRQGRKALLAPRRVHVDILRGKGPETDAQLQTELRYGGLIALDRFREVVQMDGQRRDAFGLEELGHFLVLTDHEGERAQLLGLLALAAAIDRPGHHLPEGQRHMHTARARRVFVGQHAPREHGDLALQRVGGVKHMLLHGVPPARVEHGDLITRI